MLMVSNVHERTYPVPAAALGALLDSVSGPDDRLWPKRWPPVVLDGPLAVGADGGHGPIRYEVVDYLPGRRLTCRFHPSTGVTGTHEFTVADGETPGTAVLRHVMVLRVRRRWWWSLAMRWLHDALLEDLLDRAGREVGHPPARPARWSPWVRLIRWAGAAVSSRPALQGAAVHSVGR